MERVRIRDTSEVVSKSEFEFRLRRNGVAMSDRGLDVAGLNSNGADPVREGPQPTPIYGWQSVQEDGVKLIDNFWTLTYKLGPTFATQAEQDAYVAQWTAAAQAALMNSINMQTGQRLDDFARTRNYDGIMSACTYATSTMPRFAIEGQYCVEARDATYMKLYELLAEVQAGTRPAPTSYADIEPLLPALAWPT